MIQWRLPLLPEEVRDRLLAQVDNVGVPFPFVLGFGPTVLMEHLTDYKPGQRRFLGTVSRFDFRILVRTVRPSPFSTICRGAIRSRPEGCEIQARFGFHGFVVLVFWLTLLWTFFVVWAADVPGPPLGVEWWTGRVLVPAGVLTVAGALGIYAGARRRKEQAELTALLEQVLGPRVTVQVNTPTPVA
jgi:hypothetical protein